MSTMMTTVEIWIGEAVLSAFIFAMWYGVGVAGTGLVQRYVSYRAGGWFIVAWAVGTLILVGATAFIA